MINSVQITIVGNVVGRPELTQNRAGVPCANFRVASTSRRYDRNASAWAQGETIHLLVRCWHGLATNVAAALEEGLPVMVHGRLSTVKTTTQGPDGPRGQSETVLDASSIGLDLARLPASGAVDEAA